MEPGTIVEITEDILSNSKGRVYARRGERATIIKRFDNVLIVEIKAIRFPVRIDKVKIFTK
jgi:hypothetical protein